MYCGEEIPGDGSQRDTGPGEDITNIEINRYLKRGASPKEGLGHHIET